MVNMMVNALVKVGELCLGEQSTPSLLLLCLRYVLVYQHSIDGVLCTSNNMIIVYNNGTHKHSSVHMFILHHPPPTPNQQGLPTPTPTPTTKKHRPCQHRGDFPVVVLCAAVWVAVDAAYQLAYKPVRGAAGPGVRGLAVDAAACAAVVTAAVVSLM